MKKLYPLALFGLLAVALLLFAGCGQAERSSGGASNMSASISSNAQGSQSGIRVTAIDVGKGDSILVQAGTSSMLIDTGYENTSNDVVSYLRSQGVDHLDCLVITHYDRDHVGGLRAVGKALDIEAIYLPNYEGADKHYRSVVAAIDDLGLPAQQITEKRMFELGGASLAILPSGVAFVPDAKGDEGNDDDLSLVTTLTFGSDSYLFAGDLEMEGIVAYLERGLGHFDVLKMPDHGKKSGNSDDFLAAVQPKIAIVTDAVDDPASKKVLNLLKNSGVDTYRTSDYGTVVVESAGTGSYSVSALG